MTLSQLKADQKNGHVDMSGH